MIRKAYADYSSHQLHYRYLDTKGPATKPDLYCLHPSPYSGLAFTGLMPHLNEERWVYAPDYPGYGGSDPLMGPASIEAYAAAMLSLADDMSDDEPVDLLGFHTGCLVAVEMALQASGKINKLLLIDSPCFSKEMRDKLVLSNGVQPELTSELTSIEKAWDMSIIKRIESQPIDRCFEMLAENLRPGKLMNEAFRAAFSYDCDAKLPQVTCETGVIATQSGLLEPTRETARLISGAQLIERLDITRSVIDESASKVAKEVVDFLT